MNQTKLERKLAKLEREYNELLDALILISSMGSPDYGRLPLPSEFRDTADKAISGKWGPGGPQEGGRVIQGPDDDLEEIVITKGGNQ